MEDAKNEEGFHMEICTVNVAVCTFFLESMGIIQAIKSRFVS